MTIEDELKRIMAAHDATARAVLFLRDTNIDLYAPGVRESLESAEKTFDQIIEVLEADLNAEAAE